MNLAFRKFFAAACLLGLPYGAMAASASPQDTTAEPWSIHGQLTNTTQWHPAFQAPYSGTNSLSPRSDSAESTDMTLFLGARLWQGGALYLNPEINQGFGLSDTTGVAGFPSGEASRVGANTPYARLPRAFIRQVIDLGGAAVPVQAGANQLGGSQAADNLTVTVGKFSVVDIFDTNSYAHDARADFLNWSVVDGGAFDYAADAWGYTVGAAVEWTRSWWTLRTGLFDLSTVPNGEQLDPRFKQYEWVGELEARHQLFGHPGKVKLLGFVNRANMGRYADALGLAQQTGAAPDTALVRRFASRAGAVLNIEQEVAPDLGIFARASVNNGSREAYEFTDINRSLSAGLALQGDRWGRHDDTVGVAAVVNGLSDAARAYFAAGGLGVLIGDGQLSYGTERIAEMYYSWQVQKHVAITFNFQHVVNPGYNRDRGPVPLVALRMHAEF
ncbi:carbohydrate porin [Polaromonas sp. C04]|nr:carbohydrate porin [Polaromonas sp. C04]